MNEGVKVLIERMKTNPEDFEYTHDKNQKYGMKQGRFYWVTEEMQKYLNIQGGHYYMTLLKKDDLDALVNAFKDMHQQEFTDKVMRDLFKEEEEPIIKSGWLGGVSPLQGQNAMWSDPRLAMQAQINATSGLTNVSNGGIGKTATTGLLGGLTGLFK